MTERTMSHAEALEKQAQLLRCYRHLDAACESHRRRHGTSLDRKLVAAVMADLDRQWQAAEQALIVRLVAD